MHQSFDDQPSFRVVQILPSALVLRNFRELLARRAGTGARGGITPKHYSRRKGPALDSGRIVPPVTSNRS
jgi:hypothetical protein